MIKNGLYSLAAVAINSVRISQFSSAGEQMRKINGEVMSAAKDATEAKS